MLQLVADTGLGREEGGMVLGVVLFHPQRTAYSSAVSLLFHSSFESSNAPACACLAHLLPPFFPDLAFDLALTGPLFCTLVLLLLIGCTSRRIPRLWVERDIVLVGGGVTVVVSVGVAASRV